METDESANGYDALSLGSRYDSLLDPVRQKIFDDDEKICGGNGVAADNCGLKLLKIELRIEWLTI